MGIVGRGLIQWVLVVLINALLVHLKYKGLLLRLQTAQDTDTFAQHGKGHLEAEEKSDWKLAGPVGKMWLMCQWMHKPREAADWYSGTSAWVGRVMEA